MQPSDDPPSYSSVFAVSTAPSTVNAPSIRYTSREFGDGTVISQDAVCTSPFGALSQSTMTISGSNIQLGNDNVMYFCSNQTVPRHPHLVLSESTVVKIAPMIAHRWLDLAAKMKFESITDMLQTMISQGISTSTQQAHRMLTIWRTNNGSRATHRKLSIHLNGVGLTRVIRDCL